MGRIGSFHYEVKRGSEHHFYGKHSKDYVNVLGKKFGKLTVIEQEPGKGVLCLCDCGEKHREANTVDLRRGARKSCPSCSSASSPNFTAKEDAVIKRWAGIKSTQEIADLITDMGLRTATISKIKNRVRTLNARLSDIDKISLRRKGENYPHAKMSDHDVELIRQLADEGLSFRVIAEKMEVPLGTISAIVSYRTRREYAKV